MDHGTTLFCNPYYATDHRTNQVSSMRADGTQHIILGPRLPAAVAFLLWIWNILGRTINHRSKWPSALQRVARYLMGKVGRQVNCGRDLLKELLWAAGAFCSSPAKWRKWSVKNVFPWSRIFFEFHSESIDMFAKLPLNQTTQLHSVTTDPPLSFSSVHWSIDLHSICDGF